ncbi:unnamed protein product [Caenorhabditis brenneri]
MESQNKENKESSSNASKNRKNENRIPPMRGRQNVKKEGQPKKKRTRNVKTEQAEKEDPATEAKTLTKMMIRKQWRKPRESSVHLLKGRLRSGSSSTRITSTLCEG